MKANERAHSETCNGLPSHSPFYPLDQDRVVYEDECVIAFYDCYPVSPGHTLLVAKQVTASHFDLSPDIRQHVWAAVEKVRDFLHQQHHPNGFNIGLNDGTAAGQTILHAHIHIIPRYEGDQIDPRGGVRWIFPEKANYWEEQE